MRPERDFPITQRERMLLGLIVLAALVLVMTLSGCAATLQSKMDARAQQVRDDEYWRTVQIDVTCEQEGKIGSGVRIGGTAVLTAKHVITCSVGDPKMITVVDGHGKRYLATLEGTGAKDIARIDLLFAPPMAAPPIAPTRWGERLCTSFAWPERGRRCGELWPGADDSKPSVFDLKLDFVGEHGNSGGGVWNESGNLVGILVVLRWCRGTEGNKQVCTSGAVALDARRWFAAQ